MERGEVLREVCGWVGEIRGLVTKPLSLGAKELAHVEQAWTGGFSRAVTVRVMPQQAVSPRVSLLYLQQRCIDLCELDVGVVLLGVVGKQDLGACPVARASLAGSRRAFLLGAGGGSVRCRIDGCDAERALLRTVCCGIESLCLRNGRWRRSASGNVVERWRPAPARSSVRAAAWSSRAGSGATVHWAGCVAYARAVCLRPHMRR